jgi:hypothetical protein
MRCSWKGQEDEPSLVDVGIFGVYPKDAVADKSYKFGNAFGKLFIGSIVSFFFFDFPYLCSSTSGWLKPMSLPVVQTFLIEDYLSKFSVNRTD